MPAWRSATEIAYVSDRREKPGIYANEQLIAAADGALAGPSFGPDGAIAFNAIAGSRSRLVVNGRNIADADEDVFPFRPQWITNDELLYTADGRIKRRPAAGGAARTIEFSADVSFTRPAFTPKRHRFDVAGPQRAAGITHPAISPDGTRVVFTALGDLWLMSVDGSAAPRRLTNDAAVDTDAAWSPDGRSIAFASDRGGSMEIWIAESRSGDARQLTHTGATPTEPSWSPDGSRIAFVDAEGQLYVAEAKSGATRKAHERLNEPGRPSWSPEGTALVVSSLKVYSTRFREGTNQVLRISLDGAPDRWFEPAPHKSIGMREDYGPVWSPDGSQMAAIVDGLLAVWPVARDGSPLGPPRPVSTDRAGSPSWTADSHRLLYQTDSGFKLVDVASRRVVTNIDPHLTWTSATSMASALRQAPGVTSSSRDGASRMTTIHAGRLWDGTTDTIRTGVDIVVEGARITSVEPFDGTRIYYPGGSSLDDTGQLPLQLQHAAAFGFDFIKTYVRLPDLMQKQIIEEAHRMGMPVTSHELYPAVAYGADGVEHIRGTSRRGYSPKISGLSRSYRDVIDLLTGSKMTLTPTIGIQGGFRLQTMRDASWIDDQRIQRLYPPSIPARWREQA